MLGGPFAVLSRVFRLPLPVARGLIPVSGVIGMREGVRRGAGMMMGVRGGAGMMMVAVVGVSLVGGRSEQELPPVDLHRSAGTVHMIQLMPDAVNEGEQNCGARPREKEESLLSHGLTYGRPRRDGAG